MKSNLLFSYHPMLSYSSFWCLKKTIKQYMLKLENASHLIMMLQQYELQNRKRSDLMRC